MLSSAGKGGGNVVCPDVVYKAELDDTACNAAFLIEMEAIDHENP